VKLTEFLDEAEELLIQLADDESITLSVWATGYRIKKGRDLIALYETGEEPWLQKKKAPKQPPAPPVKRWYPAMKQMKGHVKFDYMTRLGSSVYHYIDHRDDQLFMYEPAEGMPLVFGWKITSRCGSIRSGSTDSAFSTFATSDLSDFAGDKRLCGMCNRLTGTTGALEVLING
jgi:hypothetical protein